MYIGDLHIHSRYSRATSRDCTPEQLDLWARKKGIDIVGTGDFTHPAWREELKEKLEPAEEGLYVLKEELRIKDDAAPDERRPRFVVTGEISSIYRKGDRVRKVHSLLLLPGLEDAERLSRRLELIGNIHSDGRPILGLDCRDLLEIMLESSSEGIYVSAHIWTPHFSLFGAFSGFDRIEDCFEDLTPHIHALETGLSSDPPMNWRISALDGYQLISNSDAHSPAKLGREANLFDIELSFAGLAKAINRGEGLAGTLEFFPEEGKYHFDGHRKCGLCLDPKEAAAYGGVCPVCGRKLTIGVLHRVEELADREEGYMIPSARPFESLVPLPEVIAACVGSSAASKKVQQQYDNMLHSLGAEFPILREVPVEDIRKVSGPLVAEGIKRLREGEVERAPGFDGEYGTISLLSAEDISSLQGQMSLFTKEELKKQAGNGKTGTLRKKAGVNMDSEFAAPLTEFVKDVSEPVQEDIAGRSEPPQAGILAGQRDSLQAGTPAGQRDSLQAGILAGQSDLPQLNPNQQEAVEASTRAVAVIAGPGAGKTKTLISRLLHMLTERKIKPCEITAVTFTNKAASEMVTRLEKLPGGRRMGAQLHIGTFHSICSRILSEHGITVSIADEGMQAEFAARTREKFQLKMTASSFLREISLLKSGMESQKKGIPQEAASFYQELLKEAGVMDYDDLLLEALKMFEEESCPGLGEAFRYLLVDEFQDINPIQYRLIQAWNREGEELFVIGDPDQSIYGFRGSDERCFARLEEDYPQLQTIRLTQNYRSTPQILSGALSVISHNEGARRVMRAAGPNGGPIRIVTAPDERREAVFVAKEINRLVGGIDMLDAHGEGNREGCGVRGFCDIAVIYRTHRQADMLEYCFKQEGIPYVLAGRDDFLLEECVRGTLYFFRSLMYPQDAAAREQALKLLWGSQDSMAQEQYLLLAEKYSKRVRKSKTVKLLEEWAEDKKLAQEESIRKLTDMSALYERMETFLYTLAFGEDGDIRRGSGRRFLSDAVTLMTFHGSKGLEFPVVFLYGIRKGLAPLEMSGRCANMEEERRLFFVGMTRAREELILTTSGEESLFLGEIDHETVRREEAKKETDGEQAVQLSLFDFMG